MVKYWGDPKNTTKTFDDHGWLRTGDIGELDEDGYLTVVGRIKDMIIRGGENIYPKEIEEFLMKMENVQKVEVIGVHDEKYGEEIMALIMLKDPSKHIEKHQVKEFCAGKIAHYKIPRYVKFVTEFPITITGKPKKNVMRDEAHTELKDPKFIELYLIK
jgi:fatty-acyl-CoA synthase